MAKLVFLLTTFFLISTVTQARVRKGDPEERLEQCLQDCRRHPAQQEQCMQSCQRQYEKEKEQQGGGGGGRVGKALDVDPEERLQQCLQDCRGRTAEMGRCVQSCQRQYEKEKEQHPGGGGEWRSRNAGEKRKKEGSEAKENPFFFGEESFVERFSTEEGSYKILEVFTKKTDVLTGIYSYRLGFFKAEPFAFTLPHHCDADAIFYVSRGRGTIILLRENKRESYNVEEGDILAVKAGTVVISANTHKNEELHTVKLLDPAATPGEVEEYFSAGGQDPESILGSFSDDLIRAAFKISGDQLQKLAGKHTKGPMIKGSEEQIRAIQRHASSPSRPWPFGEPFRGPFNLLDQRATISNQHGELYEADERDYEALGHSDVSVGFANITKGAMELPFYNTKSPMVAFVVQGKGFYEMVCPHLSKQRQGGGEKEKEGEGGEGEEKGQEEKEGSGGEGGEEGRKGRIRYERVQASLRPNTAYVVLPGHPVIHVASRNENLQIIFFNLYARGNQRHYLAGKNNVLRNLEKEEMELAYKSPAEEVRKMLHAQNDQGFTKGKEQRKSERGRHGAEYSIMGFAGF